MTALTLARLCGPSAHAIAGQPPHPGSERIFNPAHNRDRGPVSVIALRLHAQF